MSEFLKQFYFFQSESFADGYGVQSDESRKWEDAYRNRWQHDRIVRSTHGVNCTGSCSWKIYVKNGLVTWETQQTDYPRTRPDQPNHEPRGCARGATYSWYLYSANRLKYPLIRRRLLESYRKIRSACRDGVEAWERLQSDAVLCQEYKSKRGLGGFVRASWSEIEEIIVSANIHTIRKWGPDRLIGFSPIPAMSMVSYAAGSRYLSLLGGVCMSFYDWYCDLPPASPMIFGEQTDVPESADWFNSTYIMAWGSNVPMTRTPDAHFLVEARYKGTQTVVITPDFSDAARHADIWLHPRQGTDAALAIAMGHVVLKEFHIDEPADYFDDYCRTYSDMPFLVKLKKTDKGYVADRMLRCSDLVDNASVENNPEWKTMVFHQPTMELAVPNGSIGSRWGESGKWNLELVDQRNGQEIWPALSLMNDPRAIENKVLFATFEEGKILEATISTRTIEGKNGPIEVATVRDLLIGAYGLASAKDEDYGSPAWAERICGVKKEAIHLVARQFGENALKTHGKSMVIVGAGINHWYHNDMIYRSIINLLVFCGCVGKSGGGWAHYVGQEKLRPQSGWAPLAFAMDWQRPARQMNSTSFFYAHTDQWRYETMQADELISPLCETSPFENLSLIDLNAKAERLGWLPSAPQLQDNPLTLNQRAEAEQVSATEYTLKHLKSGDLKMSCLDPDHQNNWPRNMFVWRSNILGCSGKGHEYFLRHLLGTSHGIQKEALGPDDNKPRDVRFHTEAPEGKLDLLVTLDFRMSTTCMYSDIVLPTATWYEKNDLNTSDMHPFIHPLAMAVEPSWESRSDHEIFKSLALRFSDICKPYLGKEKDVVLSPILHDSPAEISQSEVRDWMKGECDPVPNRTMPNIVLVERDYPATYERFTKVGPLLKKLGNGGKGLNWNCEDEIEELTNLNRLSSQKNEEQAPNLLTDIDFAEAILLLAPETNGHVAVKAWKALEKTTGRYHTHLAEPRSEEKIRFRDIQAQPRKIITSPIWSGIDSETVNYTANYTNVTELIPWRTLSGRQELYQDHPWLIALGEQMVVYKAPIDTHSLKAVEKHISRSSAKAIRLNFITAHQKWGIHSTYSDNLLMLTLARRGSIVWISEIDARSVSVKDNDWIEAFNANGALMARAVVSQRIPAGMLLMYHAQEKTIHIPISEITGNRGGIHNSVTRICPKPSHMIGAYAQLSWGFNYYGTIGSNRDEYVFLRKVDQPVFTREESL